MDQDDFEEFLQDACMKLHDEWINAGGQELTNTQLISLNDTLSMFFADKEQK